MFGLPVRGAAKKAARPSVRKIRNSNPPVFPRIAKGFVPGQVLPAADLLLTRKEQTAVWTAVGEFQVFVSIGAAAQNRTADLLITNQLRC